MPRLRVVAGPSLDALVPISVNSDLPQNIVSDAFEGQIAAYIKGFPDEQGNALQSEYFNREDRKGVTWSIQVQGRFLRPISADDVLFGNTFDRPLKLPWGSGAALKFMHFVDPTLEHDLASSTKPWALSPLISTMPYFAHRRVLLASRSPSPSPSPTMPQPTPDETSSSKYAINRKAWPSFPPPQSLSDDTAQLHLTLRTPEPSHSPSPSPLSSRHASPSGAATPSDSDGSMPASGRESWFEPQAPGNASSTLQPPKSHVGDKHLSKKHKRLSAASLASRLSAHHEGRLARSERKRTETFAKQEQELQELRNAARRRAYHNAMAMTTTATTERHKQPPRARTRSFSRRQMRFFKTLPVSVCDLPVPAGFLLPDARPAFPATSTPSPSTLDGKIPSLDTWMARNACAIIPR